VEVKSVRGNLVSQGNPLFSIQPTGTSLEVLAYIASKDAKGIQNGMEAEISPSTVKREENGYLRGKVESVADFPSTQEAMMRNFENQQLVESMLHAGPVTEVHVLLEPDAKASSGFQWSSPKSPDVKLSSGTMCSVEVVTESKPPITLLLPWFKNTTGL
jgi:HlyD family secretion protein